ncbi:hypothetical protein BGZ89_009311 [Linnemannia elongata]|nr:hypothetical protein BGZ89_009311 [Linnemannia elongata]
MANNSPVQPPTPGDGNDPNNNQPARKRDIILDHLSLPSLKNKWFKHKTSRQLQASPQPAKSPVTQPSDNITNDTQSQSVSTIAPDEKPLPTPLAMAKSISDIFLENLPKPVIKNDLPALLDRIEVTQQLVYCCRLLIESQDIISPTGAAGEGQTEESAADLQESSRTELQDSGVNGPQAWEPNETERAWIRAIDQDSIRQDRLRWLVTKVVQEFAKDDIKGSASIKEVVILGPVLDRDTYRSLLSCFIAKFEQYTILDVTLLQGLVQLVECAPPGYLEDDDLVRTLAVLRQRLNGTHRPSSELMYQILIAICRLLDVMVNSSVKGVSRLGQHQPLVEALTELKDTDDPILRFQVDYALQACQYIPDDESILQAVLRFSGGLTMAALGAASVCNLDPANLFNSLDTLRQSTGQAYEVTKLILEGLEASQKGRFGAMQSLLHGLRRGAKHEWYLTLLAARTFVREGRLAEFNQTVYEAKCRDERDFQLGICQILGEIAMDVLWDPLTRQHAVDFLGALYTTPPGWKQHMAVKQWVHAIFAQLLKLPDADIKEHTLVILQDLSLKGADISAIASYPLKCRLPLPESSPLLTRAQRIQYPEYELRKVRLQRLEEASQRIYIPPMAKANLQASDKDLFLLMEKVQEFFSSERQVMLILGDSGAGKSTFNKHLEAKLLQSYTIGGWIPLFINLPAIDRPVKELMSEQLKEHGFSESQIQELKQHRRFIVICDGYDESQLKVNIHTTNLFNRPGQWKFKMVITCRTQYLGPDYRNRFVPQVGGHYDRPAPDLFEEAVIAPFSKEQIESYVEQYVPLEPHTWVAKDYMDRLTTIPNLLDLVKNPFLLSLALEALPGVTHERQELSEIKITRVQLYDTFVDHWLGVNQRRLERNNALSKEDRDTLEHLINDNFIRCGIDYMQKLASAIFEEQDGHPVVQYVYRQDKDSWKAIFFGSDPEAKLLREASPLTRTGNQFRFVHRSVLEYFFSRVIYNPVETVEEDMDPEPDTASPTALSSDSKNPLFQKNLLTEPSIIQFLSDRVKSTPAFEQQLRAVIEQSKTDTNAAVAATNAITILVRAGSIFHGADLRGVKIAGADLSGGQFDHAQFQGADLRNINLSRSWLRKADMSGAQMDGVQFGELPYLEFEDFVRACAYSSDGKILAVGVARWGTCVSIYDTSSWSKIYSFKTPEVVQSMAFSPDCTRVAFEGHNGLVMLWSCTSGQEMFVINHHVDSIAFSPCGKQIASTCSDRTVRLWDSQTGENLFVLRGYTSWVIGIKYSPSGEWLASGDSDNTIRFWNSETGEPGLVLKSSLGEAYSLAFSPDGRWIASGHMWGGLQLWHAVSGEPGPVLRGHTGRVMGVAFSPDSRWIASCSDDYTVRLWDASTGTLINTLSSHNAEVKDVVFSPNGRQIASSGCDRRVRLWDVDSILTSGVEQEDQFGSVEKTVYSPDGQYILTVSGYQTVKQWNSLTGASSPLSTEIPKSAWSISSSSVNVPAVTATYDGIIRLWDLQEGCRETIRLWKLQEESLEAILKVSRTARHVSMSLCSRWIVSGDWDYTMTLWNLINTPKMHLPFDVGNHNREEICYLAFSATGHRLAVATVRHTVWIFDLRSKGPIPPLKLDDLLVVTMSFSSDGQQLAVGDKRGCIRLLVLKSEGRVISLREHTEAVTCIAYSPCDGWIASGSWDKTVRLWRKRQPPGDNESWSCVSTLHGYFHKVLDIAWNPTIPMEFVTGCRDGSLRVWRVSIDGEDVVAKLLWGTNLAIFLADGLVLKGTIGLRPMQKNLLVQRGAIGDSLTEIDAQDDYTDFEGVKFDDYTDPKEVESDNYTDSYWFESDDSTDFEGVESDDEE